MNLQKNFRAACNLLRERCEDRGIDLSFDTKRKLGKGFDWRDHGLATTFDAKTDVEKRVLSEEAHKMGLYCDGNIVREPAFATPRTAMSLKELKAAMPASKPSKKGKA